MEHLDKIKGFNLNITLEKYVDYINYFYKLDLEKRTELIKMIIKYLVLILIWVEELLH